jgi:fimbrial chaperone protein
MPIAFFFRLMRRRCGALFILGIALLSGSLQAASLQVSPVSLDMPARQAAEGLWLSNSGTAPLQAQVRVYAWHQENGEDVLKPTNDVVASPPMLSIQPGQRQIVRIIRVGAGLAPPPIEKTYRVVMDELPVSTQGAGVQFVLRYSVPIFVAAAIQTPGGGVDADATKRPAPPVNWRVQGSGKAAVLLASNNGEHHAKITQTSFTSKGGKKVILSEGLYGYVLAKSTRQWPLAENARLFSGGGTLDALVNEQAISIPISAVP